MKERDRERKRECVCQPRSYFDQPVHNEDDSPAARLEQTNHPVVGLRPQLVDLQLGHHLSLPIDLQSFLRVKK